MMSLYVIALCVLLTGVAIYHYCRAFGTAQRLRNKIKSSPRLVVRHVRQRLRARQPGRQPQRLDQPMSWREWMG